MLACKASGLYCPTWVRIPHRALKNYFSGAFVSHRVMTIDGLRLIGMKQPIVLKVVGIKDGEFFDITTDPSVEPWFLIVPIPTLPSSPLIITKGDDTYYETNPWTDKIMCFRKFENCDRSMIQKAIKEYVGKL